MHRHGYKGRKLSRQRDERRLLIKGLASDLIINEKLQTTVAKAKTVIPYVERLITKAKKGDVHNRRQVIAKLSTKTSAHKLCDQIAPSLTERSSGYLRRQPIGQRRGDGAPLVEVTFCDTFPEPVTTKESTVKAGGKNVAQRGES